MRLSLPAWLALAAALLPPPGSTAPSISPQSSRPSWPKSRCRRRSPKGRCWSSCSCRGRATTLVHTGVHTGRPAGLSPRLRRRFLATAGRAHGRLLALLPSGRAGLEVEGVCFSFYAPIRFHPTLLELSAHYRFLPRPVAPARGNEKGRVERAIRYLRDNFFAPRPWTDVADLNAQAHGWMTGPTADRMCPEDRRRSVRDTFAEEQDHRAEPHRPLPDRARRAQRRSSSLTQPRAAVLEEHRPAPQGARGRRVAYLKNTPGQSNRLAGRRVPAARRCAPLRPLRRLRTALSSTGRGAATLAVPPLRFVAPHFLAQRFGFFYLRARQRRRKRKGLRSVPGILPRAASTDPERACRRDGRSQRAGGHLHRAGSHIHRAGAAAARPVARTDSARRSASIAGPRSREPARDSIARSMSVRALLAHASSPAWPAPYVMRRRHDRHARGPRGQPQRGGASCRPSGRAQAADGYAEPISPTFISRRHPCSSC